MWAFPASIDDVVVEKGKGTLKGYEFGNKTMVNEVNIEFSFNLTSGRVRL